MLDARLPGMTGVEFQEKLARSGLRIPIIFMTGHGDIPMVRKVMKAGAVEFLTKPFDKEEMFAPSATPLRLTPRGATSSARLSAIEARLATLTPRETEVMDHVTAGSH